MHRDLAKVAAIVISVYVMLGLSQFAEPVLSGAGFRVAWLWFIHSYAWLTVLIGTAVAIGLWLHYRWAWWLGLVAASIQILRIISFATAFPTVALWNITHHLLVVVFLIVLSLRKTRSLCIRPLRTSRPS